MQQCSELNFLESFHLATKNIIKWSPDDISCQKKALGYYVKGK